jgi:phosphoribosylaminoimidazolecarboxamide formyltransferase/IMP cyclohydrolase
MTEETMSQSPRALISVHDKTGLEDLGRGLAELGFELVASGGTARALEQAGLPVTSVEGVTGFPEILGGRVKTLHPAVHGGILARRGPVHLGELAEHGIAPVDLVACNLYPFAETVAKPGVTEAEAVEQIDIGGVTLLRAAAKNHESVVVLCDPADYGPVLADLARGGVSPERRRELALEAFEHTAGYDAAIAAWLGRVVDPDDGGLPRTLHLTGQRVQTLRYGENPHQAAALYRWAGVEAPLSQLRGKELSYNNLVDLDAAWALALEFARPTVAIIKHTNPCGLASADTLVEAFSAALECDPVSAFGSIVACNRKVTLELVEAVGKLFVEVMVAPAYTEEALERLARKKKNCRVMVAHNGKPDPLTLRSVTGGLLAQTTDDRGVDLSTWRVVTRREPTAQEREALAFAWLAAKHIKSNAIVLVQGSATVGVGPGQPNRVDSVNIAAGRAGDRAKGAVLASDAFFPFADGIEAAHAAGVTAVIQPGGSKRDQEVTEAADRLGLAMVFTGERHFRH